MSQQNQYLWLERVSACLCASALIQVKFWTNLWCQWNKNNYYPVAGIPRCSLVHSRDIILNIHIFLMYPRGIWVKWPTYPWVHQKIVIFCIQVVDNKNVVFTIIGVHGHLHPSLGALIPLGVYVPRGTGQAPLGICPLRLGVQIPMYLYNGGNNV